MKTTRRLNRTLACFAMLGAGAASCAAQAPAATGSRPDLIDVTAPPYRADPTGAADCTKAIQQAANDARDQGRICFFPSGTYLLSDTISCETKVERLDSPRHVDGGTQHYWPVQRPIVLLGSTRGKRPVLKLSPAATGFDDPAHPKRLIWIWAQTWFDAPGKEEPVWGREQANISFNHIFRGIDIDVRGHAGAIGIRHSGSQGSAMLDVTVLADGAYAGLNCCPGQGGGTHNVEVIGGRYGVILEPDCRFPLLNACTFRGQTEASIGYARGGSQVPTLLVGCRLEPAGSAAVDLTTERGYAGLLMVDCVAVLPPGGAVARTKRPESLFLENTFIRGATTIDGGETGLPATDRWVRVDRFSSHAGRGVVLADGTVSDVRVSAMVAADAPDAAAIQRSHYSPGPSFEDPDVANVRDFGAKGDGEHDDTAAFAKAVAARDKVFVPPGDYRLAGPLAMNPRTHLFGLARTFTTIGAGSADSRGGEPGSSPENDAFTLATPDAADASPGLSFVTVSGRVQWRSGRGTAMLPRAGFEWSGNAGGRIYGLMAMRRPLVFSGIRQPLFLYALNVERVTSNPQSEIRDCEHVRVYYYKVEAGTIQRPNAGDGNTPCRIANSRDIRVYCLYGNVRQLGEKPMLEVVDSRDVLAAQVKAFAPGGFPHIVERFGGTRAEVPSTRECALFLLSAAGAAGQGRK